MFWQPLYQSSLFPRFSCFTAHVSLLNKLGRIRLVVHSCLNCGARGDIFCPSDCGLFVCLFVFVSSQALIVCFVFTQRCYCCRFGQKDGKECGRCQHHLPPHGRLHLLPWDEYRCCPQDSAPRREPGVVRRDLSFSLRGFIRDPIQTYFTAFYYLLLLLLLLDRNYHKNKNCTNFNFHFYS